MKPEDGGDRQGELFERKTGCSCFGGTEDIWSDEREGDD